MKITFDKWKKGQKNFEESFVMKKDCFHAIFTYILRKNKLLMITFPLRMYKKDGVLFVVTLSALERVCLKRELSLY